MAIIQPELPEDLKTAAALQQILDVLNGQVERDNLSGAVSLPDRPVSVLPVRAADGQLCLFQTPAMEAAGVPPWLLRYRGRNQDGSANASPYKWEPLGQPAPLEGVQSASSSQSTASTGTFAALTNGPSISLPLAGDYDVTIAGSVQANIAGLTDARIAGGLAGVATGVFGWFVSNAQFTAANVGAGAKYTGQAAGTAVTIMVATNNNAFTFGGVTPLRLVITPVRVG
jgi:hypothetical protein